MNLLYFEYIGQRPTPLTETQVRSLGRHGSKLVPWLWLGTYEDVIEFDSTINRYH
jgi:hypothetical protein